MVFKDSTARYWDGYNTKLGNAITITNPSNVEIYDSKFINLTSDYGGAIYMNYGNLKIINSTFDNTVATLLGGAIYANAINVNISKSRFSNAKSLNGGAIYVFESLLNVKDSNFTTCDAGFGCAIGTLNSTTSIDNSYFSNNLNEYASGAVFAMFGELNISNSRFSNNSNGNTYSVIVSDINANLFNNTFESDNSEVLAYFASLNLSNNTGLVDKIVEVNEFSFNRVSKDYQLFKFNLTEFTGDLPSYYSLVDDGYVSPVKNQKNGGNCWSFTAMAVIESCILKLTNQTYDLSEQNLKNLMAKYSNWGWDSQTNKGGKVSMTVGYLSSWLGPILDITDPYSDRNTLSHVYDELFHIDNVLFLKRDNCTDNDDVKRAILTYGAVGADLIYSVECLNNITNAYNYYQTSSYEGHAITIVGWNDTYSKNNFKLPPQGDGAWIVKNSWGADWGDNGYFYVSYYDESLTRGANSFLYTVILNNTMHYDKNYQYETGYTKLLVFSTDSFTYKNVFNSTGDEYLTAVSTYFFSDVNWTLNIYVNDVLKTTQSGRSGAGYHTLDLDELVQLKKGDIFTLEFVQKTNGGANVAFPVSEISEMNRNVLSEGLSFYKNGGQWFDMYTNQNAVICIKAFTITGYHAQLSLNATLTNITATVRDDKGELLNSGSVIFNVNGDIQSVSIENGVATLDYDLTAESYYNITATLNATGYHETTKTIIIHHNLDMGLSVENITYGEMISLNITLVNETAFEGDVVVFIHDKNYTIAISKQTTLYEITDKFDVGNYTARLIYKGHFDTINKTTTFSIAKAVNNIQVSVENTTYLDGAFIIVTADVDGIYSVKINDTIVNVTVVNYQGSNKTILPVGKYDAGVSWTNGNYNVNIKNTTFHINKSDVELELNVTVESNNIMINVTSSKPISEVITLYINDDNYTYTLSNGEFNLATVASFGKYNISVLLNSTNFNMVRQSKNCSVESYNIILDVSVKNITVGEDLEVDVRLSPDHTTSPTGNITIFIDNYNQTLSVSELITKFTVSNLAYGVYTLRVVYSGDEFYDSKNASVVFNVSKISPIIVFSNSMSYNGYVSVSLSEGLSENIVINLNGVNYILHPTGTNLRVTLPDLNIGSYIMNVTYPGDNKYLAYNFTSSLEVVRASTVLSSNSISTNVIASSKGIAYTVSLKDAISNALAGKSIQITFDGRSYSAVSDAGGVANFVLYSSSSGSKQVIMAFNGDSNYVGSSSISSITITKVKSTIKSTKKTYKKSAKNKKVTATLKDALGNAIKNAKVVFKIKNKKYSAKTKANGVVTIKAKISKKGSYKVKVSYAGDNRYLSSSKTITLKIK